MRFLLIACMMLFAGQATAQQQISLTTGQTIVVPLREAAQTVIVASEGVVRAEPVGGSNMALRLTGQQRGMTTITVQNERGTVFLSAIVNVGSPERIIRILSKSIEVKQPDGTTRLRGNVHDEYTYRCNESRCQRFTPRNRPLNEDDPQLTPDKPE